MFNVGVMGVVQYIALHNITGQYIPCIPLVESMMVNTQKSQNGQVLWGCVHHHVCFDLMKSNLLHDGECF